MQEEFFACVPKRHFAAASQTRSSTAYFKLRSPNGSHSSRTTMTEVLSSMLAYVAYFFIRSDFKLPGTLLKLFSDFFHRIYLRDVLKQLRIDCVLDVGANRGVFARSLRRIGYEGHIICFEPNLAAFLLLSEQFKGDPLWKGLNIALGSQDTRKAFNIAESSNMSSFLNPKHDDLVITDVTEVEVRRLDSIFDDLLKSLESPRVFMKLDTQGYDLEVIEGAENCIEEILGLQSEISVEPIYENMPHYLESLKVYESLGFQLINLFIVLLNRKFDNIVEYDCLMARLDRIRPSRQGGTG